MVNAGSVDSIPAWGAKIPHALGPRNQKIKQKQYCNKFNKDSKNDPHQKIFKKNKIDNQQGHTVQHRELCNNLNEKKKNR